MAEDMFLYWASGSVASCKAMLALEEKGFSGYKNKILTFDEKDLRSPEILKLNPRGQVSQTLDCQYTTAENITMQGHGTRSTPGLVNRSYTV
jgi:hypothetical protein